MTIPAIRRWILPALALALAGCATTPAGGPVVPGFEDTPGQSLPWTSLDFLDGEDRFHFVVVADNTSGAREGVFEDAVRRINLIQPAFVVSVGDLIEGYTTDRDRVVAEWDEFDGFVGALDAPFFYVAGNHDYTNTEMADIWARRYGPTYYHFIYKDVLFLALNAEIFDLRAAPWRWHEQPADWLAAQQRQLDYIERVLAKNPDVRWTFVFLHQPFWRDRFARPPDGETSPAEGPWPIHDFAPPGWPQVEAWLADRDYTLFAGHLHTYEYSGETVGGHRHDRIAVATTGGISNLRGVDYGEFDHLVWITMTPQGPVIANLLLEGILEKNFEMPRRRPWWVP